MTCAAAEVHLALGSEQIDEALSWPSPWGGRQPRAWQAEALPLCLAAIQTGERGVVSAVMGSGKSFVIAEILANLPPKPGCVDIVTTPTIRLVDQLAETIRRRCGHVGRYYTHAHELDWPIVVACNSSAPALAAELDQRELGVRLWVADEVHRTAGDEIAAAAVALNPEKRIGFTATPFRADESERIALFDRVVYEYGAGAAVASRGVDGLPDVLVPYQIRKWSGGDSTDLDSACGAMIAALGDAPGPGLANALTIEDAVSFAARLSAAGISAEAIHSRLSRDEQADLLEQLRGGGLRALVHVALLSEGVDFPWLRWICLRRAVGSRVRFAQELGRVLRACPSERKTHATVLDPNDLFSVFGLSYEAALGWEESAPKPRPKEREEREEPIEGREHVQRWARPIDEIEWHIRRLALAAQADGQIVEAVARGTWCRRAATEKQIAALRNMAWMARGPLPWRRWLAAVCVADVALSSGAASDLFGLLKAARAQWTGPEEATDLPELGTALATIQAAEATDRRCYIAVARRGPKTAVVAMHRGRVLTAEVSEMPARSAYSLAVREARLRGQEAVLPASEWLPRGIAGEYDTVPQTDHPAVSAAWRALGARDK